MRAAESEAPVFAKIVALILALGIFACALLALRQARIQAFHELTQTRLRIRAQDERLWVLRTQIASRVTPDHIHEMAASRRALKPMVEPRPEPLPQVRRSGDGLFDDLGRPIGSGTESASKPGVPAGRAPGTGGAR